MKKVHDVAWNETQAHEHNDGDMEPPKGKSHKLPIGTRGEEELEDVYDYRYKDKYGRMLIAYQIKEQELWLLGNSRLIVYPLQLAGEMRTKYLGSNLSRCNRWLISWKAFFATRTPFS
mgnify:CR=1 FL=1